MTQFQTLVGNAFPDDASQACLVGRAWRPELAGPSVVAFRDGSAFDVSARFPTIRDLCEMPDPAAALRQASGETIGAVAALLANTPVATRDPTLPWLLAPIDLQAIKAAGVTFAISMLERVIEERARGEIGRAHV